MAARAASLLGFRAFFLCGFSSFTPCCCRLWSWWSIRLFRGWASSMVFYSGGRLNSAQAFLRYLFLVFLDGLRDFVTKGV